MSYESELELAMALARHEIYLQTIVEILTSKEVAKNIRITIENAVKEAYKEEIEKRRDK